MFEARLPQGQILKKLIEAVRELVTDANFECKPSGLSLQAMDSSHVSLVSLLMRADGFDPYQCDRNRTLGINLRTLASVLKCSSNDDIITIRAEDDGDSAILIFESPSAFASTRPPPLRLQPPPAATAACPLS